MSPQIFNPAGKAGWVVRKTSTLLGVKVTRVPQGSLGIDPFRDMRYLAADQQSPVIIDAGANIGQSVDRFKEVFPSSRIHSFEPSPTTFRQLQSRVRRYSGVHLSNRGLGAETGEAKLLENSHSDMSSILPPGPLAWGEVVGETTVEIDTVDAYCDRENLASVEVLKTDTQGFDFEVIKGAAGLMASHRLHMIYMEVLFGAMYEDLPRYDEILRYLIDHGFRLVCFYQFHFQENLAGWSDALFLDQSYAPQ